MAEERPNPLALAAERKLAEADARGAPGCVKWLPDEHCWSVPSSDPVKQGYKVRRKHPPVDRTPEEQAAARTRSRGQWWWILDCSCPAATAGYAVCWHKAAVFRWWQDNGRVDGDAYGDRPPYHVPNAHLHRQQAYDRLPPKPPKAHEVGASHWNDPPPPNVDPAYYDVDDDGNTYRVPGPAPAGLPPDTTDAEIRAVAWWKLMAETAADGTWEA